MADLDREFESNAREAFLDDAEAKLYREADNIAFDLLQTANDNLDAYGRSNDYDTEPVQQSGKVTETSRGANSVSATLEWDHEAAGFFEVGTSRHPVEGDPLAFEFDAQEYPGLAEMFPGGTAFLQRVEVSGLPAGRWLRDAITSLRARLQARGPSGRFR